MFGNNKDYTALLLNCYIKEQRTDKIEEQMRKDICSESIFDVETAIEVCRQKEGYQKLAIELAEKYEKWNLLVAMYIADKNYSQVIRIIEEKIRSVKDKVKLLQQYGSQLLETDSSMKSKAVGKE